MGVPTFETPKAVRHRYQITDASGRLLPRHEHPGRIAARTGRAHEARLLLSDQQGTRRFVDIHASPVEIDGERLVVIVAKPAPPDPNPMPPPDSEVALQTVLAARLKLLLYLGADCREQRHIDDAIGYLEDVASLLRR